MENEFAEFTYSLSNLGFEPLLGLFYLLLEAVRHRRGIP